jgi:hypothetical protein
MRGQATNYNPAAVAITGGNTWFFPTGGASGVAVACPADVTEDTLQTVTLPAASVGSVIRVTTLWTVTNSANNKTLKVKIGTTAFANQVYTTVASVRMVTEIVVRATTSTQVANNTAMTSSGTVSLAAGTGTEVMGAASTLTITGQKALAGETLQLESFFTEVYKP